MINITQMNQNISGDDIGFKTIKTIINELLRLEGDKIWDSYQVVLNHPVRDQYMKRLFYFFDNLVGFNFF